MMNRMQFESIMFEEAKKAAEGTKYDWVDLLDNTQQYESKAKRMSEAEMHDYWKAIFTDTIAALKFSDEEEAE